jgi:stress-induced-phosphoprotein 1
MGDYSGCAADCDKAVERGRELRADYKIIARALARKGNALSKQEKYEEAIQVYQKALTEHRCAAFLACDLKMHHTFKALRDRRCASASHGFELHKGSH